MTKKTLYNKKEIKCALMVQLWLLGNEYFTEILKIFRFAGFILQISYNALLKSGHNFQMVIGDGGLLI